MTENDWNELSSSQQLDFIKQSLSEEVILQHILVYFDADKLKECFTALANDYDVLEVE